MKRLLFYTLLSGCLLMSACGNQGNGEVATCENTLEVIDVDLSWEPKDDIQPNENVVFTLAISHDGLPVADPNEVELEIWEHGNDAYHEMVSVPQGEKVGEFQLEWTFPSEGVYYAYYHVTACDMHRMEKEQLIVGSPDVDAILAEEDEVESLWSGKH